MVTDACAPELIAAVKFACSNLKNPDDILDGKHEEPREAKHHHPANTRLNYPPMFALAHPTATCLPDGSGPGVFHSVDVGLGCSLKLAEADLEK